MQRDTVLRWIETLSALIARILRGDRTASIELAKQQLDDAKGMILGSLLTLADHLEPAQLAGLLSDPHRTYGYARLLAFEAALARVAGGADLADRLTDRATALARAACLQIEPVPSEWEEWILEAEGRAPNPERRASPTE